MPLAGPSTARRLLDAADALEADLTCPSHRAPTRVLTRIRVGPTSVDRATWLLHVRYARRRRAVDRAELVSTYRPHARRLSRRYVRHGEPMEDLEQVAMEALLLAIERFEPTRSLPFLGYANPTIAGALKRHYRDTGWSVRVPRRAHDLASALRDAEDMLVQDLGRSPTDGEVADLLGIDVGEVRATRSAQHARAASSIDAPGPDASDDGAARIVDVSVDGLERTGIGRVDDRIAVEQVVQTLAPETRELLALYFEDQLTQSQIAQRIGVSQMQVSRLLARALKQLRDQLSPD